MLETIGWVYLGIIIGFLLAVIIMGLLGSGRQAELEQDNLHLRFIRDTLKEEIIKLEKKKSKPTPRTRRKR